MYKILIIRIFHLIRLTHLYNSFIRKKLPNLIPLNMTMTATKKILSGSVLILLTALLVSFNLPTGWFIAGSDPASYDMGIDSGAGQDGKNAATIKSKKNKIKGFGTLMQNCLPDNYLGKRVRMTAMVKTKDVSNWAGIWLRIDEKVANSHIGFDNLKNGKTDRSIKGTTDWKNYEIVLDVPTDASNIAYGALLSGTGQIWFDDFKFEVVDNSIPTTGIDNASRMQHKEPVNGNFEQ
jgi:hypothetical protein